MMNAPVEVSSQVVQETDSVVALPVYSPYLGGNVKCYVNECIDTGWVSSRGSFVDRFEKQFAETLGVRDSVSVSNGTVALHLALMALGICSGDEVIVPTFTYIASVNTIIQAGAIPIFVDALDGSLHMDPSAVESSVTSRTKAVMAVHLYGDCCDMDRLSDICTRYGIYLIEDAAEAFGVTWRGRPAGTFGDVSTFSFFGNKTITTGEGGAVLARDPIVLSRCRSMRSQSVSPTREYWHEGLGFNYRMTNIQAAIGLAQLEESEWILSRKRDLAALYRIGLAGLPLRMHDPLPPVHSNFWMVSILVESLEVRNQLRQFLLRNKIETRPFFNPAHMMPHCIDNRAFPVAENISSTGINLPSYPMLTEFDISRITTTISLFFRS